MSKNFEEWLRNDTERSTLQECHAKMGMVKIIEWAFKTQGVLICEGMTMGNFNDLLDRLAKEVSEDLTPDKLCPRVIDLE